MNNKDEFYIIYLPIAIVVIIIAVTLMFLGGLIGASFGYEQMQIHTVEAGHGEWYFSNRGEREFRFIDHE